MTRLGWLKHAFAVDASTDEAVSDETSALLDRVVDEVKRRRLELPALMVLEMSRPLNNLSAQVLHFFHPIASCLFRPHDLRLWAAFLERSDSVNVLIARLEKSPRDQSVSPSSSSPERPV
jgi:hypothetical protein